GAKIQINAVTPGESTASVIASDAAFTVTVGDTATFLGEEPLAAPVTAPEPLPDVPAPPPTELAPANTPTGTLAIPLRAIVTSVAGTTATLGIGAADGAVVGAVYALPLDGNIQARLQITEVRAGDSLATLSVLHEGFVPTVGNTARFVIVEPVPLAPTTPAAIPDAPPAPVTIPAPSPVEANGIRIAPAPVASLSGATATITAIEGQTVVISAGSAQGLTTARNLPILREGAIIGLLRLQVVNENSASGLVLWRDESLSPIAAGDAVGILGASTRVGSPAIQQAATGTAPVATPVKYETGAANFAVPRAERAYELLAALAASGLIKSQPPSVFQDEGARRHNTSEDILFSRAHIAGFVREAMANSTGEKSNRSRAAIAILSQDFRRELIQLGETPATLDALRGGGSAIGVSGFSRATLAGGATGADSRDPFAESYGQRRVQSGFDTRTNVFGQIGSNLNFYGSFDSGSDIRRGTNTTSTGAFNSDVSNFELRKAFVSYNADKLLRGLTVNLGRREFWWGVGQFGTSILSDVAGGLNSLSTRFERGSYRLEGLYAPLGRGPAGQQRAFYGQNLSIKVNNIVRVGTSATILTVDDSFNPKYFLVAFSPLSLFLAKPDDERDSQARANAVLSGFVEAAVGKGARVYGEVLIDDLSRESVPAIENRTGLLVGGRFFNPKNPAKAGFTAEFARYNSYTYLPFPGGPSDTPDYFYQYEGAPLGHPIAPMAPTTAGDAETLRFEGYYMPLKNLRLFGGVEFSDINSGDQNTARETGRGFSRQLIVRFAASYNLSRSFTLTARAQQVRTDQPNFVFGEPSRRDRHYSLEIGRSF
ncbi:MAG: hypothetical protein KY445_09990, partial [Armatimonadetes bacterium]|nr:hypothetical protein [Armatimonadota bacterium]